MRYGTLLKADTVRRKGIKTCSGNTPQRMDTRPCTARRVDRSEQTLITAAAARQRLSTGQHCERIGAVIPDCVGVNKFRKVFPLFSPLLQAVSPVARSYFTPFLLLVAVFYFNSHSSHFGISCLYRFRSLPSFLSCASLLSERATFTRCALSLSTFFSRSYSSESFPLETVRGRLVLYQSVRARVCVFGEGAEGRERGFPRLS